MPKIIIVHYGEIGLKGKNRSFFERKLVDNIKRALRGTGYTRVRRISGRLLVELDENADLDEIQRRLPKVTLLSVQCCPATGILKVVYTPK